MADFLWTFAVEETLKKVLKVVSEQIGLAWGFEDHLSKLQKWLLKAEAFLCDINMRKLHHSSVEIWVDELRHLVNQADDLLDEIVYEHLRQKVQTSKMKKVCDFISPSSNSFNFRRKMTKKVNTVIELLEKHYNEAGPLGLVGNDSARPEIDVINQFRETISKLDDYAIVGRDVEVESIVKQVIDASNQQVASILPIVGMGGLGKTTLAKLVFNHKLIQEHFKKHIWVCVSEPFIVNSILGAILQNLTPTSNIRDIREVLLREIQKEVFEQRYFLVLDDVWNEDPCQWDQLKTCLSRITGNSENCILVTTRSFEVAKIMGTCPSHHLSKLSDDQCWSLFKESARLSVPTKLEIYQKELVKKICGIPLVATVLGRAVKFEEDDQRREKMLKSVLTSQQPQEKFVLSILKLSVDHLPSSSLKQCFAYCSNFPKDFQFKKDELVQMWMAQGFIQPQDEKKNTTMENLGNIYFNILWSRCLFQDIFISDQGRFTSVKMHDLIHDIACEISSDQNLQLNPSNMLNKEIHKKGTKKLTSKLQTMYFFKRVPHTINPNVFDGKIQNFICLRVLKLHLISIDKLQLLNSLGKLKYLRYLEISSDLEVMKFPKSSIWLLYHLQTLKITHFRTEDLPKNLTNLVSLRHLEFSKDDVKKTPPCLSQLTQLQTLSSFVVGFEKDCKITELGPLKNLQGRLTICCLENVESIEEAYGADLVNKENLDQLSFFWSSMERKGNRYNDLEVLEGLQPHKNLRSLAIQYFAGNRFPDKIFFQNLRSIRLMQCKNCERLPMLGDLNNLKELSINSLHGVGSIGNEFYGNDSNQRMFFPKLQRFELIHMMNLEKWEEITTNDASSNVTTFPILKNLTVTGCPKLLSIPDVFGGCDENGVEHLKNLDVTRCNKLTKLPDGIHHCGSIRSLLIENCCNLNIDLGNKSMLSRLSVGPLEKLPKEELGQLMNLEGIKIVGCMQNYDFKLLQHLPSLKTLVLYEKLSSSIIATQLPQQLQFLTALQCLSLENFCGIEALPEWLGNFVSLQCLCLNYCQNLKRLPSREAMLRLTQLRQLWVYVCPQLQLDEGNTERAKLSHLSNINVRLGRYLHLI